MAIRTDEATLKKLAHNALPILAASGLELGHKQCLELVARMHGYENYETAKASFRVQANAQVPSDYGDGISGAEPSGGSAYDQVRRRKQAEMAARIGPDLQEKPEQVIGVMCGVAVAALAKRFPPQLSAADRRAIKENYPDATDDRIEERAMGEEGVMVALAAAEMMARIAVDYTASSAIKQDMAKDDEVASTVGSRLQMSLFESMEVAVASGMTPFGAMATAVLIGAHFGKVKGLAPAKVVRPLLDGISFAIQDGPQRSAAEDEERAISHLMRVMAISRAQAKRYLKMAIARKSTGIF